ncbi:MAG: 3-hydroxy-3-methylglutaryl-CoA reductase, partial [Candidatus Bathyarchaeia archaeon]
MGGTSQISGFYKLSVKERAQIVKEFVGLTDEEVAVLQSTGSLSLDLADRMIENVVGAIPFPLGIAVNFLINGRDYLIPMAIEEPSVVAAASYAAKMAREKGGFFTSSTEPIMIGQVQAVDVPDPHGARMAVLAAREEILKKANEQDPMLVSVGGGAKDLRVKVLQTARGPMVITELLVDCRDAMGANAVNTMAEAVAPMIERITRGRVYLRIISNLA